MINFLDISRGQYGLCILLVNWSPGIIALLHMVAYHRWLFAREKIFENLFLLGKTMR